MNKRVVVIALAALIVIGLIALGDEDISIFSSDTQKSTQTTTQYTPYHWYYSNDTDDTDDYDWSWTEDNYDTDDDSDEGAYGGGFIFGGGSAWTPEQHQTRCVICNGRGERECSSCHGTGSIGRTHYAPSFGLGGSNTYTTDQRCAQCNGTGYAPCISCGGDGLL